MDQSNSSFDLPENSPKQIRFHIVVAVLCFIAIALNACLIFFLCWRPKQTFSKTYLIFALNLAFWDLSLSTFVFKEVIRKLDEGRTYTQVTQCIVEGIMTEALGLCSLGAIMFQSLDRYFIVVRKRAMEKKTIAVLLGVWPLVACMAGISPLLFNAKQPFVVQPSGMYCLLDLSRHDKRLLHAVYAPAVFYFLCLSILLRNYSQILYTIYNVIIKLKLYDSKGTKSNSHSNVLSADLSFPNISKNMSEGSSGDLRSREGKTMDLYKSGDERGTGNRDPTASRVRVNSHTRKHQPREISLTLRTILLGSTHITLYLPFAICGILQMLQFDNLENLDITGILCIVFCFVMDPFWTLALDTKIHKNMAEFAKLFSQ